VKYLKDILLIGFLILSFGSWGQSNLDESENSIEKNKNVFKVGEWFQFRIHYGIFNASYVTLGIETDTIRGVPVFHAKGYGATTGIARFLFKVEDYYDSYFGVKTGLPIWFIRNINEGGYTKDLEIKFDHQSEIAKINDKKNNKLQEVKINSGAQDLISAFYYLRNVKGTSDMKVGESIEINMFFDAENYLFKLKYLGTEILNSKFGKIQCRKYIPFVQSGRVFRAQESVILWVSDDENKIPIRIQANIAVGSIKCDLENFKNLKYPFKVKL
tara:strand:- start:834 stop:1649 length:816 start_codon:yes stop_codon:yes gene_type:complete